jgi:hypothetical protein
MGLGPIGRKSGSLILYSANVVSLLLLSVQCGRAPATPRPRSIPAARPRPSALALPPPPQISPPHPTPSALTSSPVTALPHRAITALPHAPRPPSTQFAICGITFLPHAPRPPSTPSPSFPTRAPLLRACPAPILRSPNAPPPPPR